MSGVEAMVVIVSWTKQKLKEAGAISEESAKTPRELGLDERWLKSPSGAGVKATKNGRYYLVKH
jgi:hypothetical protein